MEEDFYPKVSIVIPVYNGESYIKQAIDSALNQTYKNIEILVVNDGSIDETESIVKAYGNKVNYFSKENGGVSSALNLAIEKMQGEYFSWLSHDDMYKPTKIEKQIEFLRKNKNTNSILYSNFDLVDENSNIIRNEIKNHEELIKKPEYALLEGAINGITLLIPKKAFEECGLFDEKLQCTQDYDMWLRMVKKYKFVHQEDILASSRIHDKQQTNINPKVLTEGNNLWIEIMENFDKDTKIKLEGSEYKFYVKMYQFLRTSQYYHACNFAKRKCKIYKNDKDYNKNDFTERITVKKIIKKCNTFFVVLKENPKKLKAIIYTKLKH